MNIRELAALKIMHGRVSQNTFSMEHYARVFHALCIIEQGNAKDVSKVCELDEKCAVYILSNLHKYELVQNVFDEARIRVDEESLLQLMEQFEAKTGPKPLEAKISSKKLVFKRADH